MRTILDHALIGFRGGEDARLRREPGAADAAMIAGAVEPLMMLADEGAEARQRRRPRQDALAIIGMEPHLLPFRLAERPRLGPDARRDRRLADVVQHGRAAEIGDCRPGQPGAAGRLGRQRGDGAGMAVGERRLDVGKIRHGEAGGVDLAVGEGDLRLGLQPQHLVPRDDRLEAAGETAAALEEEVDDPRIVGPPAPFAQLRLGRLGPERGAEDDEIAREVDDAHGRRRSPRPSAHRGGRGRPSAPRSGRRR